MNVEKLQNELLSLSLSSRSNNVQTNGHLVHLHTKAELDARNQTVEIYVCEILAKGASQILEVLKVAIPDSAISRLHHLRRFAKPPYLPDDLQPPGSSSHSSSFASESSTPGVSSPEVSSPEVCSPIGSPDGPTAPIHQFPVIKARDKRRRRRRRKPNDILWVVLCPTSLVPEEELTATLSKYAPFDANNPPELRRIQVPTSPPTTQEQATEWGHKYWPMIFNNCNPNGPHPSLVSRTQAQVEVDAARYIKLAKVVATENQDGGLGEPIGCVVVERDGEASKVIAVARDARWYGQDQLFQSHTGPGNLAAHAVMRAIGIVAKKRLKEKRASGTLLSTLEKPPPNAVGSHLAPETNKIFFDHAITPLESDIFHSDNLKGSGYLCLDLEFYVTHEPCVMCSMALVHSRVGKVIFEKRMPLTGGLTAEQSLCETDLDHKPEVSWSGLSRITEDEEDIHVTRGLGYGMFWRDDLNWRFMAWQWKEPSEPRLSGKENHKSLDAENFQDPILNDLKRDVHV